MGAGGGRRVMPWTLIVYSERALSFLSLFPKILLGLGSRLAHAVGSCSDRRATKRRVNGGGFHGKQRNEC